MVANWNVSAYFNKISLPTNLPEAWQEVRLLAFQYSGIKPESMKESKTSLLHWVKCNVSPTEMRKYSKGASSSTMTKERSHTHAHRNYKKYTHIRWEAPSDTAQDVLSWVLWDKSWALWWHLDRGFSVVWSRSLLLICSILQRASEKIRRVLDDVRGLTWAPGFCRSPQVQCEWVLLVVCADWMVFLRALLSASLQRECHTKTP